MTFLLSLLVVLMEKGPVRRRLMAFAVGRLMESARVGLAIVVTLLLYSSSPSSMPLSRMRVSTWWVLMMWVEGDGSVDKVREEGLTWLLLAWKI